MLTWRGVLYGAALMSEYLMDTLNILELKQRSDIHWARKIWHMTGVFVIFLFYVSISSTASIISLSIACALFLPVDFLRLRHPALNDWCVHALKPIMRTNEVNRLAGTTWLLTGVLIVAAVFPRPVVALTLLFLAFADPMASFIGIKYGKDKIFGHKSIQGFIAAYIVCATCTMFFLSFHNLMFDRVLVVSLLAGLVGALAELIP
ncbi:MAG: hypothetical protein EOP06_32705, partial [Proteobacteria bacterium]